MRTFRPLLLSVVGFLVLSALGALARAAECPAFEKEYVCTENTVREGDDIIERLSSGVMEIEAYTHGKKTGTRMTYKSREVVIRRFMDHLPTLVVDYLNNGTLRSPEVTGSIGGPFRWVTRARCTEDGVRISDREFRGGNRRITTRLANIFVNGVRRLKKADQTWIQVSDDGSFAIQSSFDEDGEAFLYECSLN